MTQQPSIYINIPLLPDMFLMSEDGSITDA